MLTDETTAYLRTEHPVASELALAVRDVVLTAEPDLTERVWAGWDGIGFHHPDGGYVCAIFPRRDGSVRLLFEHGHHLADPAGLLEGGGSQTRHVTLRALDVDVTPLVELVRDAVAERLFRR